MTLKILDLFAGAGGLSLGFELVKDKSGNPVFELYRAVEVDKYACDTLRRYYGAGRVIEGDITKQDIADRIIKECKGEVSIIVGGIPCQSFSLIGPRSGYGKKNENFKRDRRDGLYEHFRDIVAEIKPNIIVIENVRGILSKKDNGGGKIIDKLLSDFEDIGYVFENERGDKYSLLNAADYGVPQKRERVILIGIKKEWKNTKVPIIKPTHFNPQSDNSEDLMKKGLKPYVTVYEAIGDLPSVNSKITFTGILKSKRDIIRKRNKNIDNGKDRILLDNEKFLNHLKTISSSGKNFMKFVRPNGYKYMDYHIARSQQYSDIELFSLLKEGETAKEFMEREPELAKKLIKYDMLSFKDKYRKQNSYNPSTTIFAH
ncbi:MAG: DNA (cytosine-5-)-methyltransferase, partial [Candidatus Altiarchaeota archaeon]|nr:DNA (cytosine-5-)-methyltransferase [Candidatus Altiarchaeota archaeon]